MILRFISSSYDVRTIYQAVLITLEHLIQDPEIQRTGIIAVIDWSHFPARYATSLSPRTLRVFLEGLQDSFPMRLGALHIVTPPWYMEAALSLSKPFLKEKLKEKVSFIYIQKRFFIKLYNELDRNNIWVFVSVQQYIT